ncbi:hypothetical protein EJ04DRAFT_454081 [Polyplosphaeria fusca]|uniref:Uncharacterized protein n=1 Tax=Polyplosphaeria fusca TaxID=682080 RepID=A0A9P4RB56_9PLEO|nr:hypothetical protein EJ04DRAFT_454081 [Polyplosphaeria fusca]
MWYISQALDDFIQQDHTSKQYHIDTRFDGIYCTPDRFYKKHSESEITRLKEGQIPLLDIQQFYYEFNALYSDLQDARDHLSKDPEVQVGSSIAISRRWLSVCMERYIKQLEVNGYTDIAEVFESDWKANWRSELSSRLEGILRDTLDQKKDLAVQSQLFGTLVITTNTYGSAMTFLVDKTKLSALNQWNLRKEQPARELQFQVSEVLASLPSEELVSRAMTGDKGVCKSMEEHFWAEITRQEDQNEADFAKFWTDRVLARYYNYQEGLASVEDATLGDNLACVLSAYLVKELLPDSIAKAKAQHIVLSRNTIKNVARFEGLLASSPKTMAELNKMIDKFGKKQKIAQPDADLLAEAKRASIDDMVRRMQKQSDGPLLFLTLILVLRAERRSGVLYATGKLSPKILKDMKATLDTETYERLVKWKDSVRAGTLTLEDKKNMKETATRV